MEAKTYTVLGIAQNVVCMWLELEVRSLLRKFLERIYIFMSISAEAESIDTSSRTEGGQRWPMLVIMQLVRWAHVRSFPGVVLVHVPFATRLA